jgi:hypothetical protein
VFILSGALRENFVTATSELIVDIYLAREKPLSNLRKSDYEPAVYFHDHIVPNSVKLKESSIFAPDLTATHFETRVYF